MKLYTFEMAPNPRRVGLFVKHKGIDLATETVDLTTKAQFDPAFKAINPRCTVPALQLDDGTVLADVIAICTYLDSLYPDKPLMGTTPLEKAQIAGWCHRLYVEGLMGVADVLRNTGDMFKDRALPGDVLIEQIPALVDRGMKRIDGFYQAMNQEVEGREFLVGDSLSQADIDLYVCLGFTQWVKRDVPDTCSALQGWRASMAERLE